jgi:hypothetical protein
LQTVVYTQPPFNWVPGISWAGPWDWPLSSLKEWVGLYFFISPYSSMACAVTTLPYVNCQYCAVLILCCIYACNRGNLAKGVQIWNGFNVVYDF